MRAGMIEKGVTFRFGTRCEGLVIDDGEVRGVRVSQLAEEDRETAGRRRKGLDLGDGEAGGEGGEGDGNGDPREAPRLADELLEADHVVLAVGHSARALYGELVDEGVELQPKGFAVGFRIEHPQSVINSIQYGDDYADLVDDDRGRRGYGKVPVADYRLTHNIAAVEPVGEGEAAAEGVEASEGSPHRGVFSFCMCPGGQIVPTSIDPEEVCVNGMSFSKRRSVESTSNQCPSYLQPASAPLSAPPCPTSPAHIHFPGTLHTHSPGALHALFTHTRIHTHTHIHIRFHAHSSKWANSALVVTVDPNDPTVMDALPEAPGLRDAHGCLAGVEFQRAIERRAAAAGGGDLRVPVQRVTDFLARRDLPEGAELPASSYRLGVTAARCDLLYPEPVRAALAEALERFEARLPGFVCDEALLHGVETRTSSPVTIPRDDASLEVPEVLGLYPAGEGAGHAGGIVSAAVDGIRIANAILARVAVEREGKGEAAGWSRVAGAAAENY